jgi:hypothetical protein
MSTTYAARRPAILHLCRGCARLLGMQRGPSLFVKFKECQWVMEGRVELRCRCGLVTVVVTVPFVEEPFVGGPSADVSTAYVPTAEARPPPLPAEARPPPLPARFASSPSTAESPPSRPSTRFGVP